MTDGTVVDVAGVLAGVREVAETQIAPGAAEVDRSRSFPDADLEALAGAARSGCWCPAEHGGAGGGLTALVEACEAVGGACASTGMVFLMHSVTAATVAGGGGERAGELLGADGDRRGARHAGLQRARHRRALLRPGAARPSGTNGGVRISGRKSFVTSGGHADVMLVLRPERRRRGPRLLRGRRATRRASASTARGRASAWPATRASRWSSTTSASTTRRASARRARAPTSCSASSRRCSWPGWPPSTSASPQAAHDRGGRARRRRAATRTAPRWPSSRRSSTRSPTWTSPTRAARCSCARPRALGDAGDAAALVALMEAKVAATEARGPR